MRNLIYISIIGLLLMSCQKEILTQFPPEALQENMRTVTGEDITFEEILQQYKGKTIFVDIWASWCGDCLQGIPGVKEIQKNNPELTYLFLSLDRKESSWKAGIKKHNLQGEHYFVPIGFKGAFGKAIGLDWIPRYMIINPDGSIKLFEAVKTNEEALQIAIKP